MDQILRHIKPECATCDEITTKCDDCPFLIHGGEFMGGTPFTGTPAHYMYKQHIMYFSYYPELNFTFPELPEYDFLGIHRSQRACWRWELHHEDGNHYNDSVWNTVLVLHTEHRSIHWTLDNPNDRLMREGRHIFQVNNPVYKMIEDGLHHSNPLKHDKTRRVIEWLKHITPPVEITDETRKEFKWSRMVNFTTSIRRYIHGYDIPLVLISTPKGTSNFAGYTHRLEAVTKPDQRFPHMWGVN